MNESDGNGYEDVDDDGGDDAKATGMLCANRFRRKNVMSLPSTSMSMTNICDLRIGDYFKKKFKKKKKTKL